MTGIIGGINTKEDMDSCNADTFNFHILKKSAARIVLKHLKPPEKWIDNLYGNARIDYEIFQEYLASEKQQHRREVLENVIPWGICLSQYDPNYEEVFEFFRYRMIQERDRYHFSPVHITPDCWFQDDRGRRVPTPEETMKVIEMKS
jgi:hypothetical protein